MQVDKNQKETYSGVKTCCSWFNEFISEIWTHHILPKGIMVTRTATLGSLSGTAWVSIDLNANMQYYEAYEARQVLFSIIYLQSNNRAWPSSPMTDIHWSIISQGMFANSCSAFWHSNERNEIILLVVFAVWLYNFAYTFCPVYTATLTRVGFPNENVVNPG